MKAMIKVVIIDNFDSFVYNLADMLGALGAKIVVLRNDVSLAQIIKLEPTHLVISPGPGRPPDDVGISCKAITHFAGKIPILGVCLGHQTIGHLYGAQVVSAKKIVHGKTSTIYHNSHALFAGVKVGFSAGRYHSLAIEQGTIPSCLEVIATTGEDQEIMAVAHKSILNLLGVQFHPESILSADGSFDVISGPGARLLANFLAL